MEYFMMRQDPRVHNVAKPVGEKVAMLRHITRDEMNTASIPTNLFVQNGGKAEFPDFIEDPVMLVSEKLKKVMSKYQKDAVFKTVVLIERETNRHEVYYLISAPRIDCASCETTYDARGNFKELVIDQDKVGHARIFFPVGNERRILVRLDVAESILRRHPYGVWFERIRVMPEEG